MEDERKTSDWRGTLQCLGHVALLFAPIAIGLGVLVMISADNDRRAAVQDPVTTGSIHRR
jgi:hypothetical protein